MRSCKEITELIERQQEEKLPIMQRMELGMHTMMCKHCGAYKKQTKKINDFLQKENNHLPPIKLPDEKKEEIIKKIEKKSE